MQLWFVSSGLQVQSLSRTEKEGSMQVIKHRQERGPAFGERKAAVEGAMLHPGRALIPRPHLSIGT